MGDFITMVFVLSFVGLITLIVLAIGGINEAIQYGARILRDKHK